MNRISFSYSTINLTRLTEISYLARNGISTQLTVRSFEWGKNYRKIIFYTNNPFGSLGVNDPNYSGMKMFQVRRLSHNKS